MALGHEFDSSMTCDYCGVAEESPAAKLPCKPRLPRARPPESQVTSQFPSGTVSLNMNQVCRVRLTARGVITLKKYEDEMAKLLATFAFEHKVKNYSAGDVFQAQLFTLFRIFGAECILGHDQFAATFEVLP